MLLSLWLHKQIHSTISIPCSAASVAPLQAPKSTSHPIPSSQELVRFWGCSLLAPSASKDLSLVHITLKQQQPVGNPEVEYLPPIRSETRSLLASSAPWCSRECLRSIQPSFAKKTKHKHRQHRRKIPSSTNPWLERSRLPLASTRAWVSLGLRTLLTAQPAEINTRSLYKSI